MTFQNIIEQHFPGTISEADFVRLTYEAMEKRGFTDDNTIACVGVCRDELCRSLVVQALDAWGEAFNFSSLAGMLFLGKTGFSAATHHAPLYDGIERYVFFAMAHIGIGPDGQIGWCEREGREGESTACGALAGMMQELESGTLDVTLDTDDVEQSILKARMLKHLTWGEPPNFVRLTKVAYDVIREDLKRMLKLTIDEEIADYGVLTGIQIHAKDHQQYIWPGELYTVVRGEHEAIQL